MNVVELAESRVVIGDGAMGTMLQKYGLEFGECPERFNLEKPEVVRMVHKDYADSGAEYVETNTLGANRMMLARHNLDEKLGEVLKKAVVCAREGARENVLVGASVGPTGRLLEPYGDASVDELRDVFREVATYLDAEDIDFFIVETMIDINEAVVALEGVTAVSEKPIVATMSFQQTPKGMRTVMGNEPADCADRLRDAGASIVGTNCCNGVEEAIWIIEEMRDVGVPTIAQPNAGVPVLEDGKPIYKQTPERMADDIPNLIKAGARLIGGCCGTTPDHIRAIRQKL